MKKKKKNKQNGVSTRQLMGIDSIKEYGIATKLGDIVFFIVKPTNISVLPDASVSSRIFALLNVVKGQTELEMLAMNSKESFEDNKGYYRNRMDAEDNPAIRKLLEYDSKHLDRIQVMMASAREFYIMVRMRNEKESEVFPLLARIEKNIKDNGFITRRANDQDLMRMLGVYFEQNVTTERYDRFDGERWITGGDVN